MEPNDTPDLTPTDERPRGRAVDRRSFLILAGSTLAGAALAACGGGAAPAAPATPAKVAGTSSSPAPATGSPSAPAVISKTGSKVNVVFWGAFGGNLGKSLEELVAKFNASQSDITVEHQFQGSYEDTAQKLSAAIAGRQVPDTVVLSDVWWYKFYLNRAIAEVTPYFQRANVDTKDYVAPLILEGTRTDKVFWVPFARSTPLFYYNKEMFQAAGLPDRGPRTWTELIEWAPRLVKKEGGQTTVAAHAFPNAASYVAWLWQGTVWQWGGRYSDDQFTMLIDQPPGVEMATFFQDQVKQGNITTPKDHQVDFQNGQVATIIASTGSLAGITTNAKFPFGTAFLPEMKQFGCPTGGAGLAILDAAPAEKKQAAFEWIRFATSPENTTWWSQNTGYMPVRTSAVQSADMQAYFQKNPNFKVAVDQLPRTQPQDAARVFVPNGDQIIGKGIERILVNKEDVTTVWKSIAAELTAEAKPVLEAQKARGA